LSRELYVAAEQNPRASSGECLVVLKEEQAGEPEDALDLSRTRTVNRPIVTLSNVNPLESCCGPLLTLSLDTSSWPMSPNGFLPILPGNVP